MRLYSRIIGDGKPLIILHGLFGMSDNWITIGNTLAEHGFRIHLIDLRNHGKSPHAQSHRYPDMCEDLLGYFDQHNIEKARVIGHSMGGKLGMVFGLLEPERINKLIVVDIAPSDYGTAENNYHHDIIHTLHQIDLASHKSRGTIRKDLAKRLGDQSLAMFLAKSIGREKKSRSFVWKFNLPVLEKFLQHIYIGLEELSIYAPCPVQTLFVKGNNSSYYLDEHESDRHFFFPESSVVGIDNAGHWLHSDQPELFIETVVRFLC
jgi:esterase